MQITFILEDIDNHFYYANKNDTMSLVKTELESIHFCKVLYIYEVNAGEKKYIDRDYGSYYEYSKRRYVIIGDKYEDNIFETIHELLTNTNSIPFQICSDKNKNKYKVILYNIKLLQDLNP